MGKRCHSEGGAAQGFLLACPTSIDWCCLRLGMVFMTRAHPKQTPAEKIKKLSIDVGGQLRLGAWVMQLSYGLALSPSVAVRDSAYDPRDRLDCLDTLDYTSQACEATR